MNNQSNAPQPPPIRQVNDGHHPEAGANRRGTYTGPERRRGMNVDLTINLPTIISIIVLTISAAGGAIGMYISINEKQAATNYAVATLNTRVDRAEASIAGIKTDQGVQFDRLRADVKGDLADIKGQLGQIIFGSGNRQIQQRQLREWSKE